MYLFFNEYDERRLISTGIISANHSKVKQPLFFVTMKRDIHGTGAEADETSPQKHK